MHADSRGKGTSWEFLYKTSPLSESSQQHLHNAMKKLQLVSCQIQSKAQKQNLSGAVMPVYKTQQVCMHWVSQTAA